MKTLSIDLTSGKCRLLGLLMRASWLGTLTLFTVYSHAADALSSAGQIRADNLTALLSSDSLSLTVMLYSLLVALGLGALHALSPGHGKTLVGAYLVGERATLGHALFLGLIVTVTHTAGVFALGFIALFASHYILPEQIYPWLELVSGLLLVWLGVTLFRHRLQALLAVPYQLHKSVQTVSPVLASCTAGHVHAEHTHFHIGHTHSHSHYHDGHSHSHLPPVEGSTVNWRSLLTLGISGGLVPCPTALMVLLAAIALHQTGFGLLLILAFSLGLAGVLIGIGLLCVYARGFLNRFSGEWTLLRFLPTASALLITLLGLGIVTQRLF